MLGTQERVREVEHNMGQGQDALSKTNEALHAETARSAAVAHASLPADTHVTSRCASACMHETDTCMEQCADLEWLQVCQCQACSCDNHVCSI